MSLVETAISLLLAALVVVSAAGVIASTTRSLGETRRQEQATQLALEGIEWARGLTWDQLRLGLPAENTDPNIDAVERQLLGSRFELGGDEALVEGGEQALVPPVAQESLDESVFVIRSYVTEVSLGLRRVVVEVTWDSAGSARRHVATTLVSEVSAG